MKKTCDRSELIDVGMHKCGKFLNKDLKDMAKEAVGKPFIILVSMSI